MKKIIITDDSLESREILKGYLAKFFSAKKEDYRVREFTDGLDLVEEYPGGDILFLDVEMKNMDGLLTAKKIRERDKNIILVYETKMAQYAAYGYDVDAIGYLVKPYTYESFYLKMEKAYALASRNEGVTFSFKDVGKTIILSSNDILYLEADGHQIFFYGKDKNYSTWGTLAEYSALLLPHHFYECSRNCLVNLRYVTKIEGDRVFVGDTPLSIGRTKKKAFLGKVMEYYRGF